jgi:hypothetical protein
MRKFFFAPFMVLTSLAVAQMPPEAGAGYESIRAADMRGLLSFLADDALEGRETATRGLDLAARFLETQFTLFGLTPAPGAASMLQSFDVQLSRTTPTTRIEVQTGDAPAKTYRWLEDFFGMNVGLTPSEIEAALVFAGYGISAPQEKWDDYNNLDVRGKIVLLLSGRRLSSVETGRLAELKAKVPITPSSQARTAQEKGAAAVFFVGPASIPEMLREFRHFIEEPRVTLPSQVDEARFANLTISEGLANLLLAETREDAAALQKKLATSNKPIVRQLGQSRAKITIDVNSWTATTQNVVAYLEGSDADLKHQAVVFSAHYDHVGKRQDGTIYNGADDDGSGTTAILEIAQAFATNPLRPKRSVMFIGHAGEEKGLLGSEYFTSHPLVPLENLVANLNIDMIGRNDSNQVYIIGSDHLSTELHRINESANQQIGLNLDYTYNDVNDPNRFYYRSDHYNFAKHGIPIIFYFTGTHSDYHQPGDDIDKINFEKMQRISRLVYLTGWHVANLDHALVVDRQPPDSGTPSSASGH